MGRRTTVARPPVRVAKAPTGRRTTVARPPVRVAKAPKRRKDARMTGSSSQEICLSVNGTKCRQSSTAGWVWYISALIRGHKMTSD
ncbi:MAG: hypothetical protein K5787_18695 [Lentisphaeria bacterium]|nr:hypothetical protein [Lentisphaeria bacterium]